MGPPRPPGTLRPPSWGRRVRTAAGTLAVLCLSPATRPALPAGLTSPPIDGSLFRDGEVRHTTGRFGPWTTSCDEVPRLRQKYCSLKTAVADDKGRTVALLTVSTGDDGRPAALIELPFGVRLASAVTVEVAAGPKDRAHPVPPKAAGTHVLDVAECDATRCYAVWNIDRRELSFLNSGVTLSVRYRQVDEIGPRSWSLHDLQGETIVGLIPSESFAKALASSLE